MKHDIKILKIYNEDKKLSKFVNDGKIKLDDCDEGCEHQIVKIWYGIACKVCGGALRVKI